MLVSLCTVCKNRADHYKQTILKNIQDNINDADVEYILLDYNSGDDLEQWVNENLCCYIERGLLTYYKTFEPQYFQRSHSRNMAFRLAKGDLICNVDADNYTGKSFSSYLREQFAGNKNIFICAGGQFDNISRSDIGGRICLHKDGLLKTGGYDEEMINYGFEDFDLINRLEIADIDKKLIKNGGFLDVIEHDTKNRIIEEFPYKNIRNVLVNYVNPSVSAIILLFLNDTFALATIINQQGHGSLNKDTRFKTKGKKAINIESGYWTKGNVKTKNFETVELIPVNEHGVYFLTKHLDEDSFMLKKGSHNAVFYNFKDVKLIEEAVLFYSETCNRTKMQENFSQKIVNPNRASIGCGTVYKNFDYTTPIILQ